MSGTDTTSRPAGSPLGLGLAITVLGPLIGSAVLYLVVVIDEQMWREPNFMEMAWHTAALIVVIGWPAGVLPALVSAIVWIGLERHLTGKPARILVAALIGGVTGATLVWPFLNWALGSYAPDHTLVPFSALAGALSLLATARPWRRARQGGA